MAKKNKRKNMKKILVVEDESIVAMDITNMLENLGYQTMGHFSSGEKAIEKIEKEKPDLILMDIILKGKIDGITAAGIIQKKFRLPVVYVSAFTDKEKLDRAKLTKPFGYLVKPFEERELNTIIEMALYKKNAEDALINRDKIMEAVSFIAKQLQLMSDIKKRSSLILERLGKAANVCRVYIYKNHMDENGDLLTSNEFEWIASGIKPEINNPDNQNFSFHKQNHDRWVDELSQGNAISGLIKDFPEHERRILQKQNIQSIMCVPIFVDRDWWGFIGFHECDNERIWSTAEIDALKAAADIVGTAIYRKRSDNALLKSEEKYRLLVESSGQIIFSLDKEGKVLFSNKISAKTFGFNSDYAIGKKLHDLVPIAFADEQISHINKVIKSGVTIITEQSVKVNDLIQWYETRIFPLKNKNNSYDSSLLIANNITERKNAENEIIKSHDRFLKILDSMDAGISICDLETHNILFMNKNLKDNYKGKNNKCCALYNQDTDKSCEFCFNMDGKDADSRTYKELFEYYDEKLNKWYSISNKEIEWIDSKTVKLETRTDITPIRQADNAINLLMKSISEATGQELFDTLLQNLCKWLNVEFGVISRIKHNYVETIALLEGKEIIHGGKESLKGLSFDEYAAEKFFYIPEGMQKKFPENEKLKKMNAEGCVSIPIFSQKGKITGFLSALSTKKIEIPEKTEEVMTIMAARIRSEIKRIEAESKVRFSRDQLKKIIDSTSELIISVNNTGLITEWNDAIAAITGIQKKKMIMQNVFRDNIPDELASLMNIIKSTLKNKKSLSIENEIKDINKNAKVFLSSTSLLKGENNNIEGVVLMAKDITDQREILHNFLPGRSYISFNESFTEIIDIFNSFSDHYSLLFVSRGNPPDNLSPKVQCILMTRDDVNPDNLSQRILKEIKEFILTNKQTAILINRFDYFEHTQSFHEMLKFIYQLNDLMVNTNNILIAHTLKECFDEKKLTFLKDEFNEMPSKTPLELHIKPEKLEILRFIEKKNNEHSTVNYTTISKEYNISRLTVRRWLKEMQLKGLIRVKAIGKIKTVFNTERGRYLISQTPDKIKKNESVSMITK